MSARRERQERQAIFWCTLLSPLLLGEIPVAEAGRFLRELSTSECLFPDGQRRKPSRATLWRKWKQYREGGFDNLQRRPRRDRGQPRKRREALLQRAEALKRDQPRRSDRVLNHILEQEFQDRVPRSTLYRHLRRVGATRRKLGVSQEKVRRRWTRDRSNDLWLGDFEDGPYVFQDQRFVETHLSAFIDCHSRYIVEARYYLRENLDILLDSLLRAWDAHGASRELYLDNAKIYHAHALRRACCALNIRLLHRSVGDPPPGGLIERFFHTVQGQLEAEVRASPPLTLEQLNRALRAWLSVNYHEWKNEDTGEPPRQRYEQGRSFVRPVNLEQVSQYFLRRERRKVDATFSDIRLNGHWFAVDPRLRGDWVEVRYDAFRELETVQLYSQDDQYLGVGRRHDRQDPPTQPPAARPGPAQFNYVDLLIQQHEKSLEQRSQGIDYQAVVARGQRRWPLIDFVQHLAHLLGRAGGLSAFRTDELEVLQQVHQRLTRLDARLLERAVAGTPSRSLPEILFLLQQLHDERNG